MKDIKLPWVNAGERLPSKSEFAVELLSELQCRYTKTGSPCVINYVHPNINISIKCAVETGLNSFDVELSDIEWLDDSPEAIKKMIEEFNTSNGGGE